MLQFWTLVDAPHSGVTLAQPVAQITTPPTAGSLSALAATTPVLLLAAPPSGLALHGTRNPNETNHNVTLQRAVRRYGKLAGRIGQRRGQHGGQGMLCFYFCL